MLDTSLIDVTDGAVIEVADSKLVCLVLDIIIFVDLTDDADVNLLLNSEPVNFMDVMEIISLLEMLSTEVTDESEIDNVLLVVNITDAEEYCSPCIITLVGKSDVRSLFVTILEEATVCIELSCWLLEAELTDNADLLDTTLVTVINDVEDCSVILKGVVDGVDVKSLVDVVLIIITDAVNVVMFSSLLDATLVDLTDVVVVSPLLDKVFREVIDDVTDGSLLDISLLKVVDDVDVFSILEMTLLEETDVNGVEITVLLDAALVTVIDVAEMTSALLLDIILVDVKDKEG